MQRGSVVQSGGLARSERGPRRAAPAALGLRGAHWDGPVLPRHTVVAIGGGRYRVTTVVEQIVSEDELRALGLEAPPEDVPWRAAPALPASATDKATVLRLWSELLGGHDPRLSDRVPVFIRDYGLEVVKRAIGTVAATNPKGGAGAKYAQLVRVLREMGERKASR